MKDSVFELVMIALYAILLCIIICLIVSRMLKDYHHHKDKIRTIG